MNVVREALRSNKLEIIHRKYTTAAQRSILKQNTAKIPVHRYPIAAKTDTRVYVWGLSETGALGIQTSLKKQSEAYTQFVKHPSRLSFAENRDVNDVAAGYGFSTFAVKPQDNVYLYGTGINTDSQVGFHKHGGKTNKPIELLIYPAPIPLPKKSVGENLEIVKVAAGRAHQLALSETGVAFAMGNNSYGQCGRKIIQDENYTQNCIVNRIENLSENDPITSIDCGQDHSFFLTASGKLFSCGWSDDGQTGLSTYGLIDKPTLVGGDVKGENIVKVNGACDTVLAINDKGELFGWGNTEYGQLLEDANIPQVSTPRHLDFGKACGKIVDIAVSGSYCLILNENGDVFSWGYGILGFGPNVTRVSKPTQIPATLFGRNDFNPNSRVCSIYCGLSHSAAINDQHDLYMWGRNKFGCLGFGNKNDQFFPLKVSVSARVLKVSCGVDHTLALCKAFI